MIKRTIYLNDLNDLDMNNLGVHFTANLGYKHNGGGSNGTTKTNTSFRVDIYASDFKINEEATEISNANYSKEQEVVLEMNQSLNVKIKITPAANGGWGYPVQNFETIANTGTRADQWVETL